MKLSTKNKTIQPKKSFILKLTGTSKNAEWSVPKEYKKIIKIKKKGKNVYRVTGLNSGEGYVQATLGKKTYKCKVTVVSKKYAKKAAKKKAKAKHSYDDIKYTGKTSKNNALSSVAGGYIGEVEFSSAGTCAVKLSETVTVDLYENEWEFDEIQYIDFSNTDLFVKIG